MVGRQADGPAGTMEAQGAARPEQLAKLEAKWQEREADKLRRRELAAEVSDPAESAHVFWQVRCLGEGMCMLAAADRAAERWVKRQRGIRVYA